MISIIICSRKADIGEELKQNIAATIGCDYELCIINNAHNDYTIFSAYNEGVAKAKGDVLCFMHEDILFHSDNWGKHVQQIFSDNYIGCVGVIGSWFLPNKLSSWWQCQATKGHILQGYSDVNGNYYYNRDGAQDTNGINDVVVVDGCWFCISKAMFDTIRFDEQTYNSFHCYDVDICMQVIDNRKRVVISNEIDIEHKSLGNINMSYYDQLALFYQKWQHMLPYSIDKTIPKEVLLWVSDILYGYQKVVMRNVVLEKSKSYNLGKSLLKPFKWIKG